MYKKYILLSACAVTVAFLSVAYKRSWIILISPFAKTVSLESHLSTKNHKAELFYWRNEKWHKEAITLVSTGSPEQDVAYLVNSLLTLLQQEKVIKRKITLVSVAVHSNGTELFLSFDKSPCDKQAATFDSWMLIESILKTMRSSGISYTYVHFLVDHQPLVHSHLDFHRPWPIEGFINPQG